MHGQEGCKKTTNLEAVVTQVAVTLKLPSANWGVKGRFHITGGCLPTHADLQLCGIPPAHATNYSSRMNPKRAGHPRKDGTKKSAMLAR